MIARVLAATLALAIACAPVSPAQSAPPSGAAQLSAPPSSTPASLGTHLSPTPLPLTFATSAQQARMVATLIAFLDAYNAGRVETALALLADDVGISDCDYRAVHVTLADGTEAARQWLGARVADHDQLVVQTIRNDNPDPQSGSHVVALAFARRSNDTLRSLGFANGITPQTAAKVVFTNTDERIRAFANGPFGGPAELCRPARA